MPLHFPNHFLIIILTSKELWVQNWLRSEKWEKVCDCLGAPNHLEPPVISVHWLWHFLRFSFCQYNLSRTLAGSTAVLDLGIQWPNKKLRSLWAGVFWWWWQIYAKWHMCNLSWLHFTHFFFFITSEFSHLHWNQGPHFISSNFHQYFYLPMNSSMLIALMPLYFSGCW